MRRFRTPNEPYLYRLLYDPPEIDQICEDALRSVGLLPKLPEAVRIDRFLEKYFGVETLREEIEEGVLGCTVFNTKGRVTGFYVSPLLEGTKSGDRRERSTLAHEGGHGLLHPSLFLEDTETSKLRGHSALPKPRFMCREEDIGAARSKAYNGKWWEWQANRAIAGLLLPKKLVGLLVEPFLKSAAIVPQMVESKRAEAVHVTAETFDVNPAVARIRLQEMYPDDGQMML